MLASEAGARDRECMLPGRRVLATGKWEGRNVWEPRVHPVWLTSVLNTEL